MYSSFIEHQRQRNRACLRKNQPQKAHHLVQSVLVHFQALLPVAAHSLCVELMRDLLTLLTLLNVALIYQGYLLRSCLIQ